MGSLAFFHCFLLLLLPILRSPAQRVVARASPPLVVNEVYYDHPGTDDGYEFIEIINPTASAVGLDGVSIEFHNGSGVGWEVRWSGGAGDSVAAGGLFLVGGALVAPAPAAVVALALQNGPDAVRLAHGGETLDLVGYGGLDDADYVETRGAPATGAGRSLARVPDGADADDNGADFAVEIPSPGGRNVPIHDAALVPGATTRVGDVRARAGTERLRLTLRNAGLAEIPAGAVTVTVDDSTEAGTRRAAEAASPGALAPGGVLDLDLEVFLEHGYHWLTATARYADDERAADDTVVLVRRVGPLELLVSEVLAAARDGCPQFVEIHNAGARPRSLRGFGMRDRTHAAALVTLDSVRVEPGAFVALTPDVDALRRCFPHAPPDHLVAFAGAWPSLNRSGGAVADSVILLDALGLPVEAVAYPSLPSGDARSLERVDLFWPGAGGVWVASRDPAGGTPGAGPAHAVRRPVMPGELRVSPNPFAPEAGQVLEIALAAPGEVGRAVVDIYDVRGRLVAGLGAAEAFPAVFLWDGAAAPPGIYVVACRWYDAGGAAAGVEKVVVGRAGAP
jgi:hypothetical protein